MHILEGQLKSRFYNYIYGIIIIITLCKLPLITKSHPHLMSDIHDGEICVLKSICVEFDLHKVVITSLKLDSLLKRACIYNYAVELISSNWLKVSIFHVEVPGILVNHKKHKINVAIFVYITSGAKLNANKLLIVLG